MVAWCIKTKCSSFENKFGEKKQYHNPILQNQMRAEMSQAAITLNTSQRIIVLEATKKICCHRNWLLFAAHVRTNHVHCIIQAHVKPELIMQQIKAAATKELRVKNAMLTEVNKIWTKHGSTKYLWHWSDLMPTMEYVVYRQGKTMACYCNEKYRNELRAFVKSIQYLV